MFNIKLDVAFVFKQIHFNQIILLETIHASYNITKFYGKQYSNRLSVVQGQYAFSSIHYFVLHLELVGKPFLKNRTIQNVTYLGHVWYANSVIKDFCFFTKRIIQTCFSDLIWLSPWNYSSSAFINKNIARHSNDHVVRQNMDSIIFLHDCFYWLLGLNENTICFNIPRVVCILNEIDLTNCMLNCFSANIIGRNFGDIIDFQWPCIVIISNYVYTFIPNILRKH